MEEKVYINDLYDGTLKNVLKSYSCTNCGLVPHYIVNQPQGGNHGLKIDISTKNWDKIDNLIYCPLCVRKIKIERLRSIRS